MNGDRNYKEILKRLKEDEGIPYISEEDFAEFEKTDVYYPEMTDSEYCRGISNFIQPEIISNFDEYDELIYHK
jgi:hypothetical protein